MDNKPNIFTVVGTNIAEVKKQNANSGLTYNELNEWFTQKVKNDNAKNLTNNNIKNPK